MGRGVGIAMTVLSDLFHAVAIILMVVCLAVGNAKPTDNFSWTKFKVDVDQYHTKFNLGLHQYVVCETTSGYCQPNDDLDSSSAFNYLQVVQPSKEVGKNCYTAGSGVIAMATFAMLFGLLAIASLHTYTTFKRACGCTCPVPRIFVAIFSLLSLALYIGSVSIWFVKCQNNISGLYRAEDVSTGYALMVAIICTVFSFLGWLFATIRSFMPAGDDSGAPTKSSSYGASSGSASPAHANGGYNSAQSPSNGTGREGQTFGY